MTVFSVFKQTPYTFLKVTRGNVYGNQISEETELLGIFKNRAGNQEGTTTELTTSSATLHAHPEDFAGDPSELIGQGIRHNGINYQIANVTAGTNFETGIVEHLTLTLQREDYAV